MKLKHLKLVLALVIVFAAVPAFAGTDCKKCAQSDAGTVMGQGCVSPESGQWGTEACGQECYGSGPDRWCFCTNGGFGCLYEVVQG